MSIFTRNWRIPVGCLAFFLCLPSHAATPANPEPSVLSYQPVLQNYRRFTSVTPLAWQQAMQNLLTKPDSAHAHHAHHHHQHAMPTSPEAQPATKAQAEHAGHGAHQHGTKP